MLDGHDLHGRGIVPRETIDGLTLTQVRIDNFAHIGGLQTPVPHPFRINDHHGTFITESHAAAGGELHISVQAARLYLAIEPVEHSERPARRAGGDAFRLLLGADEEMKTKRFHSIVLLSIHHSASLPSQRPARTERDQLVRHMAPSCYTQREVRRSRR